MNKLNGSLQAEWPWKCEFCNCKMTLKEHNFCDICPDCRDKGGRL